MLAIPQNSCSLPGTNRTYLFGEGQPVTTRGHLTARVLLYSVRGEQKPLEQEGRERFTRRGLGTLLPGFTVKGEVQGSAILSPDWE